MSTSERQLRPPAIVHPVREMASFVALTFGITWSLVGAALLVPDWIIAHFGPINDRSPLFYLAVRVPNIAAITLSLSVGGWSCLRRLLALLPIVVLNLGPSRGLSWFSMRRHAPAKDAVASVSGPNGCDVGGICHAGGRHLVQRSARHRDALVDQRTDPGACSLAEPRAPARYARVFGTLCLISNVIVPLPGRRVSPARFRR